MRKRPLLSVVVPVYNAKEYIIKCLDSIELQGFNQDDLEIICVDDGCTDGTGEILDNYANEHLNVKVFHKVNGGECSARNYGLDRMTGQYYLFVDSDDSLIPYSVLDIVNIMVKEQCDVAQFEYVLSSVNRNNPIINSIDLTYSISPMTLSGSVWRYVFSSDFLGHVRFDNDLHFAGDTFFSQTVALYNPKTLHTSRVCYEYNNQNANSVMAKRKFADAAKNMLHLAENHKKYLDDNVFPDKKSRVETWCSRATAGYVYYSLRAGKKDSPFKVLKLKGLWPYKIEWSLLKIHGKKNGGLKQTVSNYILFLVRFRPLWWIFAKTGLIKNK